MRIAMISEHASPLAVLGGADAGGQNAHVAELSAALAAAGHDVRVYTRRDAPDCRRWCTPRTGSTVVHVPAGPPPTGAQGRSAAAHAGLQPVAEPPSGVPGPGRRTWCTRTSG